MNENGCPAEYMVWEPRYTHEFCQLEKWHSGPHQPDHNALLSHGDRFWIDGQVMMTMTHELMDIIILLQAMDPNELKSRLNI